MPVQMQYIQLIEDKTNAANLSSGVLTILIGVIQPVKTHKFIAVHKFRQKLAKNDITHCSLIRKTSCSQIRIWLWSDLK